MRNANSRKRAPTRRDTERDQRRAHILTAAERVFGRRPFDEASMQEIAAEAEVGMQGLYLHFKSKQVLYESVILHRLEELGELVASPPPGATPVERMRHLAVLYARQLLSFPQYFPLYARQRLSAEWSLKSRFGKAVDKRISHERARLRALLAELVQAGALRPLDLDLLVSVANGIFDSVLQHHLLRGEEISAEDCATEMIDLLLHGVGQGVRP